MKSLVANMFFERREVIINDTRRCPLNEVRCKQVARRNVKLISILSFAYILYANALKQ